jgi:hypothetical protein
MDLLIVVRESNSATRVPKPARSKGVNGQGKIDKAKGESEKPRILLLPFAFLLFT